MKSLHPRSPALRSTLDSRTTVSAWLARGFALLTGTVLVVAVGHNVQPQVLAVPEFVLPVLFGACLMGSVAAARSGRSSRLVYLWLYVLFGANEVAAWLCDCPIESAAAKLGGFLVAGVVVLVPTVHRERRAARR